MEGPARRRWHVAPPAEFWAEEYLKALEDGDQAYAAFCAVMGGLAALADKENIAVTRALLGGASDIKNIAKGLKSALAAKKAGKIKTAGGGGRIPGGPVFKTNGEAAKAAEKLGFRKINERSQGQAVFTDGKRYITRDIKGHKGGAWKMADSVEDLGGIDTRLGTYDIDLNRVGD